MNLVILYGPPAVGKLTVAKELAEQTGYKLFHNHLTVDLVTSVFNFGDEQAQRLSTKFRLEMFEEAAKAGIPGLIFTFVYAKDIDDQYIQKIKDSVEPLGGKILLVLLKANKEVLLKRVEEESRKSFNKMKDPEKLRELFEKHELFEPIPNMDSLIIDNTNLVPEKVVSQIIDHYNLKS